MRSTHVTLALLLAALLLCPTVGEAQPVLYDPFADPLIDPALWWGNNNVSGGPGNPTTESVRVVQNQQLRMAITQHGLANTDSGTSVGSTQLFASVDPAGIIGMQARVKVTRAETGVCPAAPAALSRARAQLIGWFFNDGTSPGAGNRIGDIVAGIHKISSSGVNGIIEAFIVRCTTADCSSTAVLAVDQFSMTWTPGKVHTLSVQWDAANNKFVYFAKAATGPAEIVELSYVVSDTNPAVVPLRGLQVLNSIPNCNGMQLRARMDALFDTVMVSR